MGNETFHPIFKRISPILATIIAIALSFLLAYWADSLLRDVRLQAESDFHFHNLALTSVVLTLFEVFVSLGFAALLLMVLPPNRTSGVISLAAGLIVVLAFISFFFPTPLEWLRSTPLHALMFTMVNAGTQSFLDYLASSWIVVGIAAALRRWPGLV
jgi:hypothetical protein